MRAGALLSLLILAGAAESSGGEAPAPELGAPQAIEEGIVLREAALPRPKGTSRVWVYLPAKAAAERIPCVLIAPAGTRLFHGIGLGDGDRAEHLPYVRAGFVVVAYEIDGPVGADLKVTEMVRGAKAFQAAEAGLANARAALDFALAKVPEIDAERVYAAGHSSAATLSLLLAEREPRVKASVAFAPVCDVPAFIGEEMVGTLDGVIPKFREFLERHSPDRAAKDLRVPVFLFHADDDTAVSTESVEGFAKAVKDAGGNPAFVRVEKGGHYDSMIQEGIPKAIEWLRGLAPTPAPAPIPEKAPPPEPAPPP